MVHSVQGFRNRETGMRAPVSVPESEGLGTRTLCYSKMEQFKERTGWPFPSFWNGPSVDWLLSLCSPTPLPVFSTNTLIAHQKRRKQSFPSYLCDIMSMVTPSPLRELMKEQSYNLDGSSHPFPLSCIGSSLGTWDVPWLAQSGVLPGWSTVFSPVLCYILSL